MALSALLVCPCWSDHDKITFDIEMVLGVLAVSAEDLGINHCVCVCDGLVDEWVVLINCSLVTFGKGFLSDTIDGSVASLLVILE